MLTEEDLPEYYQQKLDYMVWNRKETPFMNRIKKQKKIPANWNNPLSNAILKKFKKSVFGTFLTKFNPQQNQTQYLNENKLQIFKWILKEFSAQDLLSFQKRNNFTDEALLLLEEAVKTQSPIECQYLFENILSLKIIDSNVSLIDKFLRKFKHLQILILSCNWISAVPGKFLPRCLKFLELNTNEISNLRELCVNPPNDIRYIGLGRNKLQIDCNLEQFTTCQNFIHLQVLDLSNNDIYELIPALEGLKKLSISSLHLEGNPCWTSREYKNAVTKYLPNLKVLDGIRFIESDKSDDLDENLVNEASFVFVCHRVIGLPAPPKEKGVKHTLHLEVALPLLDENYHFSDKIDTNEPKPKSPIELKTNPSKNKKKEKKSKSNKNLWPYVEPHEPDENQNCLKTSRIEWAKMMDFSKEYITIRPSNMNLIAIRDTFKSKVNVKVVYLKSAPPKKGKSKKESKKNKKKKTQVSEETPVQQVLPEEIILKRITVANFFCELYNIPWSERTIDFYWALHPQTHFYALPVEGRLHKVNYVDKKSGFNTSETPYPTIFTCQVGFGLERSAPRRTNAEEDQ